MCVVEHLGYVEHTDTCEPLKDYLSNSIYGGQRMYHERGSIETVCVGGIGPPCLN